MLSLCPTSRSKGLPAVPAGKVRFFSQVSGSAVYNQRAARTVTLDKINIHYTEDYDNDFDSIAFYRNYPEYRPFVGKHFAGGKSKILLLAESHYLPIGSTAHLLPKNWYENSSVHLTDEERRWINTRGIINSGNNQHWKHKGHTIYRHIEKALIESGIPKSANSFSYIACMNAFQRPAKEKDSLRVHEIDTENAFLVLSGVIEILKPDHICFVSSKAWKHLGGKLNVATDVIPHPASAWWHRVSKNGTGKQQFISLIKKYIA